jgi:ribosome-associated heat shock protein Hsp15
MEKMRIDKWLWSARFYKTRTLAAEEIDKGRIQINGQDVKPARDVKAGDTLSLRQGPVLRTVVVKGLSMQRGAAPVAQLLYEETPESLASRLQAAEQRKLATLTKAGAIAGAPQSIDSGGLNHHRRGRTVHGQNHSRHIAGAC